MGRPVGPPERLEERRRVAMYLFDKSIFSLNEIARLVRCAPSSVMRWRDARRRHGAGAFRVRFSPGRPPKLSQEQINDLDRLLLTGKRWSTSKIARLIHTQFGVTYHRDHVGRLLHRMGWTFGGRFRSWMPSRRRRIA